uniref:C-type lectin domain-containing protein n=1 Tax=Acrobeloides nanus TaxID=290746 RepID=A0A914DN33_9BILA
MRVFFSFLVLISYTTIRIDATIYCNCNDCSDWIAISNSSYVNYLFDSRRLPGLANGHVGTIVYNSDFHVNGFYHGQLDKSNRVRVPNFIAFWVESDGNRTYTFDIRQATFTETIWNTASGVNITTVMYANMADKHYLVTEITMSRKNAFDADVTVQLKNLTQFDTWDMKVLSNIDYGTYKIFQAQPETVEAANVTAPNLTVVSTSVPTSLTLSKSEISKTWVFYSVITMNNDSLAISLYNKGQNLSTFQNDGTSGFMTMHKEEWEKIWQSRIDVIGNCSLARVIHSSYYYILSSTPISTNYDDDGWPFFGLSPASLANDDSQNYHGHVFWDQDLWMLIGLLPFYPEVVKKALLDSRVRHLEQAKQNAQRFGWDGAEFPWEAAYSGYECTDGMIYAQLEIHITGDVALSAYHYLKLTGDADFAQKFYETSLEIAKFFYSRLQPTHGNLLGIFNVMPPDEYHYPVNNSAYTNTIARVALELPFYIKNTFNVSGVMPQSNWNDSIAKIYIPFDSEVNYHPEFDDYPYGPAMTWSMHAIGWLDVNDELSAKEMFQKNYIYIQQPFDVWTETYQGGGAENFITGIGGFLQNLAQGYLGLRIYEDRLEFKPFLIPDAEKYNAIGVAYQEMIFNFAVDNSIVYVNLTSAPKSGCVLIDENGKQHELHTGNVFSGPIKIKRKITCQPSKTCTCPSNEWFQSTLDPCNCLKFSKNPIDWNSANNDSSGENHTNCSQFFIGLNMQTTNQWTWINNDSSLYRNWRPGYPISDNNLKCSQLNANDGKWTNIDCSSIGCYICEIRMY